MLTRIQRWGNSQGVRLTRELLSDAGMEVGDGVDVRARDGVLVVTPVRRVRGRVDLAQLVREIPADYEPGEFGWGPPAGEEAW